MLPKRLKKILEFIDKDDIIADIGTDHGYLLQAALDKGVKFVQGVENKKGPYMRACQNLERAIKEKCCIVSLSDGLNSIEKNVDTIVIAGMGGELITNILQHNLNCAKKMKKLILCPNIKNYELRKFLSDNLFTIIEEAIINEDSKFYEILVVRPTSIKIELSERECIFGPCLLKAKNSIFRKKWEIKYEKYLRILNASESDISSIKYITSQIKEVLYDESQ